MNRGAKRKTNENSGLECLERCHWKPLRCEHGEVGEDKLDIKKDKRSVANR